MTDTSALFGERRRSERHPVRDLRGTLHLTVEARVLNMSMTGMAVETDALLPVGRRHSITFGNNGDAALRLAGAVVWCRERQGEPTEGRERLTAYTAGFRFDHEMGQRAADVSRFLQAASLIEVGNRISGRIRLDAAEPVRLGATFEFSAANLSAGGALVETEDVPTVGSVVDAEFRFREHTLRTRSRVARIHDADGKPGGGRRRLGLEFVEASHDGRDAIRRFVSRCIGSPAEEAEG